MLETPKRRKVQRYENSPCKKEEGFLNLKSFKLIKSIYEAKGKGSDDGG